MRKIDKQQGFTLLEVMIALSIGLTIIGAVVQMFLSGLLVFNTQTGLAKLQENGRFAANYVTKDVRSAGYFGCDLPGNASNNISNSSNQVPAQLDIGISLIGEDNATSTKKFNGLDVKEGTDTLSLKYVSSENTCEIASHNATNARISCQANHSFPINQPLVATDCNQTSVFLQSNDVVADSSTIIEHAITTGTDYKNCTSLLGDGSHCSALSYTYSSGMVMALNSVTYFIANNNYNQPALYRNAMVVDGSKKLVSSAREMIEGVEDMQILYGEDTDNSGSVNLYAPYSKVDMSKVISIRIGLLLRSVESNLASSFQTYHFNGQDKTATDYHLRKVYTTTIAIRNRM